MEKLLVILSLVLFCNFSAIAQTERMVLPYANTGTYPTGGLVPMEKDLPLIIIGTSETNAPSLIIDHNNLKIIKRYEEPEELKHFGDKGNFGIIVAELKRDIPLFRLEEVLDYFKVPAEKRDLQVLVDKKTINPDLFLADIKKIKKIEVFKVTQEDVLTSLYYNQLVVGDQYLNIVTSSK